MHYLEVEEFKNWLTTDFTKAMKQAFKQALKEVDKERAEEVSKMLDEMEKADDEIAKEVKIKEISLGRIDTNKKKAK